MIDEGEEGIFDGCFYVWVSVTEKYMSKKEDKNFNDYNKLEKENSE
ncbi:MAG: hypothetical protein M1414_02340 [Candidatus Thermoplasmatota archaeon]|jgi:hypothetical protein|nr:hypothetical protein [Candidatus Thermoplasmatota archaeon]MCL5987726.1 hypothetical protein [Candidatus Thermoplasmatota archaeon]